MKFARSPLLTPGRRLVLFVFSLIAFEAAASTITIVRDGTGGGTVTASSGSIACGATCSGDYADGAMLTLTALPADGSQFTGCWGLVREREYRVRSR
jgi:hypothetical protein